MNPFDWRGPPFLLFYLLACVIGLVYLYRTVRGQSGGPAGEPSPDARNLLRDPYLLAFLRRGPGETLRTAVFSLHKRGLLISLGKSVVATNDRKKESDVHHPLERAVLARCASAQKAARLIADSDLTRVAASHAQPLRDARLIADTDEMSRRFKSLAAVVGALLALGVIKIGLAVERGHSNIALLLILMIVVVVSAFVIVSGRRTYAGDRALADMQTLFTPLKSRANRLTTQGAIDEAVLFAAVFGLAALPGAAYPFAADLHKRTASCGAGGGCGSGGGGCGGGGGGCGGCGGGG